MKDYPTVSVIIPAYNYGRFLKEAVASVQAQTVTDLEIIVVDDGSTDNTPALLADLKDKDPRLLAVRTVNRGDSAARNAALPMVRGKYVAFLDADDRWRPHKLELQIQILDAEPEVGFVFSDFVRFDANGIFPETQFSFTPAFCKLATRLTANAVGRVIAEDTFSALAPLDPGPVWLQTSVFRRDCVEGLRFPEGIRLGQDLYYLLLVYARGIKCAFIEEPLAEVRRHENNSYRKPSDMFLPVVKVLRTVLKENLSTQQRRILRRRLADAWSAVGYHEFWNRQPLKATLAYTHAMAYPGRRWNVLAHILASPFSAFLRRDDNRHN